MPLVATSPAESVPDVGDCVSLPEKRPPSPTQTLRETAELERAVAARVAAKREALDQLVLETEDIRLDKLVLYSEGVALFDELCLRLDVNQKYASLLPQWKDLAAKLDIDTLRTQWIETCVRPNEGLTR